MNLDKYFNLDGEKPLDNLIECGGGLTSIFRTIGCIGDSLSSGEFESFSDEGVTGWHDFYDYSWGQYIARAAGCKVYNFSKGGMSAKEFMDNFGSRCGFFDNDKICQCYIIALGVNDITHAINQYDGKLNVFAESYENIILSIKRRQPKARIFLMTIPKNDTYTVEQRLHSEEEHTKFLYSLAEKYKYTYLLDFRKYAPVYGREFREKFFLAGHLNPAGYYLTSQMVMSYIDYIIRHNMEDFKQIGFVGTPYYNSKEKW